MEQPLFAGEAISIDIVINLIYLSVLGYLTISILVKINTYFSLKAHTSVNFIEIFSDTYVTQIT